MCSCKHVPQPVGEHGRWTAAGQRSGRQRSGRGTIKVSVGPAAPRSGGAAKSVCAWRLRMLAAVSQPALATAPASRRPSRCVWPLHCACGSPMLQNRAAIGLSLRAACSPTGGSPLASVCSGRRRSRCIAAQQRDGSKADAPAEAPVPPPQGRRQLLSAAAGAALLAALQAPDAQAVIKVRRLDALGSGISEQGTCDLVD